MDPTNLIIWVGRALALFRAVKGASPAIKAEYQQLVEEITSGLPAKPDGSRYTIDDVIAAAEANRTLSQIVRARHS